MSQEGLLEWDDQGDLRSRVWLALNQKERFRRGTRGAAPVHLLGGDGWRVPALSLLRSTCEVCSYLLLTTSTFSPTRILGVAIKFGKFSAKENQQLEKNVQEFLSLTGIENADKLLYTDRYPEEKAAITNLKRKYAFRLHIGEFRCSLCPPLASHHVR